MKTNRFLCVVLTLVILMGSSAIPVMADENIKVLFNGAQLAFDVPPQLINNRTMVPMRKIFEAMGADVDWDDNTQTVTAKKDEIVIIMQIDNAVISVSGKEITLDVPPQLVDDRTLVPVRAVAEGLDADVKWDDEAQTVIITKEEEPVVTPAPTPTLTPTPQPTATPTATPTRPAQYPEDGALYGYGNDGLAELQYTARYGFEQHEMPKTIFEYEKETIDYIKSSNIRKMKENILAIWELAAANVIVNDLMAADEEYVIENEDQFWALIDEKRPEYGLGAEHIVDISMEKLDERTSAIVVQLTDTGWVPISTYVAVAYNETAGLNYFTLEKSLDIIGDGNVPYLFCHVEADRRGSLFVVQNDRQSFIIGLKEAMNSIIAEDKATDTDVPSGAEKVGMAYMDPAYKMMVMLNNPEWVYYKDKESDPQQVYFFNNVNPSDENLISISAYPFDGDADKEMTRIWEMMVDNQEKASSGITFEYKDKKAIQAGNGYSGFAYPYEINAGGTTFICNAVFWTADDMMYTCTTSATVQGADEVQAVLDGILASFTAL